MKTINNVFLILLVSLVASAVYAQNDLSFGYQKPKAEINTFVQSVSGAGDLVATVQAADRGYVTVSRIDDKSFLVMKIKASGKQKWARRLSFDVDNYLVRINGIAQTTDGGFILAGQAGCDNWIECGRLPMSGGTLIKLRANGTVAWKKSYAEASGNYGDLFVSVIPMPDGGVIAIGGRIASPYLIVRVTATGDVVWKKHFGTFSYGSSGIHSTATPDNGFIVTLPSRKGDDVLKITDLGDVVWQKRLKARRFVLKSVGATADGGVILAGTRRNSKLKVAVLKADGTLDWKAGYSVKASRGILSVSGPIQTSDGGYVLTGTVGSCCDDDGFQLNFGFVAKIDSSRKIAFQNTFSGDVKGAVFATADGGFLLFGSNAGSTSSDLLVLKVNSEGIVAGCNFFQSLGETERASFGRLTIRDTNIAESDGVSLEAIDLGLTSVASNNPVSSVCH